MIFFSLEDKERLWILGATLVKEEVFEKEKRLSLYFFQWNLVRAMMWKNSNSLSLTRVKCRGNEGSVWKVASQKTVLVLLQPQVWESLRSAALKLPLMLLTSSPYCRHCTWWLFWQKRKSEGAEKVSCELGRLYLARASEPIIAPQSRDGEAECCIVLILSPGKPRMCCSNTLFLYKESFLVNL